MPLILRKSRMRRRARTDPCGGVTSDGRPYRDSYTRDGVSTMLAISRLPGSTACLSTDRSNILARFRTSVIPA
jgi:hypothetical protein